MKLPHKTIKSTKKKTSKYRTSPVRRLTNRKNPDWTDLKFAQREKILDGLINENVVLCIYDDVIPYGRKINSLNHLDYLNEVFIWSKFYGTLIKSERVGKKMSFGFSNYIFLFNPLAQYRFVKRELGQVSPSDYRAEDEDSAIDTLWNDEFRNNDPIYKFEFELASVYYSENNELYLTMAFNEQGVWTYIKFIPELIIK